ncbi:Nulp1-pending protein [Zalerion maritima]|uniref:Nulp1-pending protein n=1 Tax=Zalerion maritima TaxID=339359 RepID=A0AAD5RK74_9PEZI|nr:Nulp1-pending protein [Zalerion maritima]
MSRRQLRKLQKGKEDPELDLRDEDEGYEVTPKPRQNAFAGFAALEGMSGEDEDNDEVEQTQDEERDNSPIREPTPPPRPGQPQVTLDAPAKKKKRGKKKRGNKPKQQEGEAGEEVEANSESNATTHSKPPSKGKGKGKGKVKGKQSKGANDGMDEIDRAIQELGIDAGATQKVPTATTPSSKTMADLSRTSRLLQIKSSYLKVGNEMRSLFGKDTVAAAEAEEREQATGRRQAQMGHVTLEDYLKAPPGRGLKEVSIKNNYLIQGKKTWPMGTSGGLSMTKVNLGHSSAEFSFIHEDAYDKLEKSFFGRSSTYNPDLMIEFLHSNPYHISSLVVVSKIAKHQGDHALAADLRERALFTFGRIMLSSFKHNLEEGTSRLDFRRLENRQFWLAAYQYLRSLMRRGTHRTALEWAKLLLQLDPSDPYAIGQVIHITAMKAKEYQWLLDLCETDVLDAHWGYPKQTAALAKLRLGDERGAAETARAGMQEFPWLYSELFKDLGMDVPKSIWGRTIPHGADELYTALYLQQAKELWNYPKATDMLFEAAHGFENPTSKAKAKEVPLGLARMLYLDENQDLMALVPRKLLHSEPNYEFDPLPPAMENNIFSSDTQRSYFLENNNQPRIGRPLPQQVPPEALADAARLAGAGGQPSGTIDAVLGFMRSQMAGFGGRLGQLAAVGDVDDEFLEEIVRRAHGSAGHGNEDDWSSDYVSEGQFVEEHDDEDIPPLIAPNDSLLGSTPQMSNRSLDGGGRTLQATVEDDDSECELPPLVDGNNHTWQ